MAAVNPVLLKDADVWLGGYDISGSLNSIELTASKAELADGRLGDGIEAVYPGLRQTVLNLGGYFAAGAGEPDAIIGTRMVGAPAPWPLTIAPPWAPTEAPGAYGNIAYTLVGDHFAYTIGGAHGELLPYNVKTMTRSEYRLYRQTMMIAKALQTATKTADDIEMGALLATQQMICVLDVFAITGGDWTLTIESDVDTDFDGSETVRATFTVVSTAPTRQVKKIVGPITDAFWRAIMTKDGGTNLTYAVSMGIHAV